jgi:hypothetical protein
MHGCLIYPRKSDIYSKFLHKPTDSTSDIDDAYWIAAMKAAKKGLLRRDQTAEKQGGRTHRIIARTSKNLLEGVNDSLQRRLQVY